MIFDHAGVVVPDFASGRGALFWVEEWTDEFVDEGHDVAVQFGRDASGLCYELIVPLSHHSPAFRAMREHVNILNHMAFKVACMAEAKEQMVARKFYPLGDARPAVAYGGGAIQFFLAPNKMLVELIEAPGHTHEYRGVTHATR